MWSEWLLHRRHADDLAYRRDMQAAFESSADRVLEGAQLHPGMTLVDVGAGDGLLAFRAIDRIGPTLQVVLTDISARLLRHAEAEAEPGLATNLSSRPYIRGAELEDVLVEFDGIPLTNPFHFQSFQSLISAFDPFAVGRVDLYTGGFPVQFGTRSGRVIDLAPRSIDAGTEFRAEASLISYDIASVGKADHLPLEWLVAVRHSADSRSGERQSQRASR